MYERDISDSAEFLIAQFGRDAAVEAAMRSDRMRDRGDMESAANWGRVVQVIIDIQTTVGRTKH